MYYALYSIGDIARDKSTKRKQSKIIKSQIKLKNKAKISEKFEDVHKDERKRKFRDQV